MPEPTMNQYTEQFLAPAQQTLSSTKFDQAAAAHHDLTSFLDFSSFDPAAAAKDQDSLIALPPLDEPSSSHDVASTWTTRSPLRPVDDALLDSPLGLELSPADSIFSTSSISDSPYDLDMSLHDFGTHLAGGGNAVDSSPLFGTVPYSGSPADLVFPSFSHTATSAAGTPGMITTAELPSLFAALPLVAAHELADIKPIIPTSAAASTANVPPPHSHPTLARQESTESVPFSFEDFIGDGGLAATPAQTEEPAPVADRTEESEESSSTTTTSRATSASSSAAAKRKTLAEIKREAAMKVQEKEFSQDKHLGFRNTKKKMVDYDAPTLPKNYLTESATSKKRAGSTKVNQSVTKNHAAKRVRTSSPATSSASATPLPETRPTPLDANELDDEQLSQIELKRRQNTLAARKSRMRKAETFKMLSDEVEKLKQLNEALMEENRLLKARLEGGQPQ
ncbi:hypothetical protein JCM3766R1_004283 [Sporobolomyces carnicolor]